MRKIVAGLFISLDGVVEAPDQWHFPYFNDEMGEAVGSQMAAADTMLLGGVTYQEFAGYWPQQGDDVEFADLMNNTPKLVVSTTLDSVEWQNSTLINGDVAEELAAQAAARQGHRDHRQRHPRPLAAARRPPRRAAAPGPPDRRGQREAALRATRAIRCRWSSSDSKTFSTGVLALTYRPAGG